MPDLNMIDQELQRRGIDPAKLSFLLNAGGGAQPAQPSTPATGSGLSFVRNQPMAPRPLARPRADAVSNTAPEIAAPTPGTAGPALSFANRTPAVPTVNSEDPTRLSFVLPQNSADRRHFEEAEASRQITQEKDQEAGVSPTNVPSSPALPGASATGANMMNILAAARANRGVDQPLPQSPGPAEKRFGEMEAQGAPKLHGWKKILDIAGQIVAPGIEGRIPGTPGNFNARLFSAAKQAMEEQKLRAGGSEETERQARIRRENALGRKTEIENEQALQPGDEHAKLADLYADAVKKAVAAGRNPLDDADVKYYGDAIQNVQREPAGRSERSETPFSVWRKQHPNDDVKEYFKLQPEARNETRPPERPSRLTANQKATLTRRYKDALSGIEEEFRARQSGTYVDKRSGELLPPMTDDELTRRKQDAEDAYKDELEAGGESVSRYDYRSSGGDSGATRNATNTNTRRANSGAQHQVGDEVTYKGQRYRIAGIKNGKAQLAPLGANQ